MTPALRTINNASLIKELLLDHGLRANLRRPLELSSLDIEFGQEPGEINLQWGQTRVYAKTEAAVVEPSADRSHEGFLIVHTELSPMAHSHYELGRPSEEELLLNRLLEKGLRRSRALDLESLCLVAGEKVWSIRIALHVLANCGSLSDCLMLAASIALRHFRKPEVTITGSTIEIHNPSERVPRPLEITQTPIPLTWSTFTRSHQRELPLLLLGASTAEEALRSGSMNIAVAPDSKEVCLFQKLGGAPVHVDSLMHCVDLTFEFAKDINLQVQTAIQNDAVRFHKELAS